MNLINQQRGKIIAIRIVERISQVKYFEEHSNHTWWFDLNIFARPDLLVDYQNEIGLDITSLEMSSVISTIFACETSDMYYYKAVIPNTGSTFKQFRIKINSTSGQRDFHLIHGPQVFKNRFGIDHASHIIVMIYYNHHLQMLRILKSI